MKKRSLRFIGSSAELQLSEYLSPELYYIVIQNAAHGDDTSAYVQSLSNTSKKKRFEELVGLPACDLASILLVLMGISTRFFAEVFLVIRAGFENMNIDTNVEIYKFRETWKLSSLDPQNIKMSEKTEKELNILETQV